MAAEIPETREYPLYGTNFTVHRLSPLFVGKSFLDVPSLTRHASTFRNILAGEVLRGVRVGLASDDDVLARAGGLETVQWAILRGEEEWQKETGNDTTMFDGDGRGMLIEIMYAKASYSAVMLNDEGAIETPGFLNYPLLLTRMPRSLRETFLDFLATTFDTRTSILNLPSNFLQSAVEKYCEDISSDEEGPLSAINADKTIRAIMTDVMFTISFDIPGGSASLKSIDITIAKDDVSRMITRGRELRNIGGRDPKSGPFITALKQYMQAHVAIDMDNNHVSVSKIVCGAFIIGIEGKLKLFAPSNGPGEGLQIKAANALVKDLIVLSRGSKFTATAAFS